MLQVIMADDSNKTESVDKMAARKFKTVGRYEIIRPLGTGSMGLVHLGWDPYIKRNVAIKMTRGEDRLFRESFFVEAQSAGSLNHPNIVSIYDFGLEGDYCFITMEYVEGKTLEHYCLKENLPPTSKVIEIIISACQGLTAAHGQGIIHRDIKPSNILLDGVGAVKIMDFGIAQIGSGDKQNRVIVGTPHYIAPERLKGCAADPRSDIFSLGCVLYELLTGEKAFPGESLEEIKDGVLSRPPRPIADMRPDLPAAFGQIMRQALEKSPDNRFPDCNEFAFSLRTALRGVNETSPHPRDFFDNVQNLSFFHNFTKEQVRELVTASNVVRVRQGRAIIRKGDIEDVFYILLSGRVNVSNEGRTLAVINSGECFGEMSLISNKPRHATVAAETDCTLLKISSILLNRSSERVQLLFYQNFASALVRRLEKSSKNT